MKKRKNKVNKKKKVMSVGPYLICLAILVETEHFYA